MGDVRNKPCMSHYPDFDHHCASKGQGCEYYEPKELYVAVHDLSFCLHDEDGNEVQNKDGTTKQFHLAYKADKYLDYFIDGLEVTDLEEKPE